MARLYSNENFLRSPNVILTPLQLHLEQVNFTEEQFDQLCLSNPDLKIERSARGDLIVLPPVGGESGNQEIELGTDLNLWNRQTGLGKVFSSSTLFCLPGGGDRSPDVAWIELNRWNNLTPDQQRKFPPISLTIGELPAAQMFNLLATTATGFPG